MPEAGQQYTLNRTEPDGSGRDVPTGIGRPSDTNGYVKPGSVVTVREVVSADQPGAHDNSEDAVVLELDVPYVLEDENGGLSVAITKRAFSVGLADFDAWFEEVEA